LFTTFSQIDSSLSRNYQGTGLGLALVKKLTELQGGMVSVQSTYGVGSTFSVTIPKQYHAPADVVSTDAPTVSVQPATVEKRKKSILIVDDNEVTAFNVKDYLDNYGFKTSVAFTGVEAINKAAENPPDVMLVDIQMPGIDGIEVIRTIRSNPVTRQIKIIAVTALAMPGDRERCLWAGADDHMRKPVELKKLILLIDRYSMR
jgi:CheY-like chemotaxis protein